MHFFLGALRVNVPTTARGHIDMEPWLRVAFDRLEELGIELRTDGYKVNDLSTILHNGSS